MSLDAKAVIQQIEELEQFRLKLVSGGRYEDASDANDTDLAHLVTLQAQMIEQFAPVGSPFRRNADSLFAQHGMTNPHFTQARYAGILAALKTAYEQGYLQTVQELVHADLFADFLEMATYLLSENFKDPAAVLAGGVLEEALRKVALKSDMEVTTPKGEPKRAGTLNEDLARAGIYNKIEQANVLTWLALRNKAAHGQYAEYDRQQVEQYIDGIRGFLTRHRA